MPPQRLALNQHCSGSVSRDHFNQRETELIEQHNTYENPKGFNLTPGGEGGIRVAAAKPFAFLHLESVEYFYGNNLAQFCREQPQWNYNKLASLRRGDIDFYQGFVKVDVPDLELRTEQVSGGNGGQHR